MRVCGSWRKQMRIISIDKTTDGLAIKFDEKAKVAPEKLMEFYQHERRLELFAERHFARYRRQAKYYRNGAKSFGNDKLRRKGDKEKKV